MISYPVGRSGEVIHFDAAVIDHFERHRQLRFWHKEAGGQLFARIDGDDIVVVEATGPRPSDRRGRTYYHPKRSVEQAEIAEMHARDLHYIGDWHSHPEPNPRPSSRDDATMASRVRLSRHTLKGFVFVIVGQADPPTGMTVVVHDGSRWYPLDTSASSAAQIELAGSTEA